MKEFKRNQTESLEAVHTHTHTNILEKQKNDGITLIALVVTIVVLLILAGVSINLVIGNNGIITKARNAQIATRAGSAEDEVEMWKTDNYIARNTGETTIGEETILQNLKDKKLVYEEEIDRANKLIKIKGTDGTLYKEISYREEDLYYVGNVITCERVGLLNKETDEMTTFSKAYIMFNGEKVEISSCIEDENNIHTLDVASYLFDLGKCDEDEYFSLYGTKQTFIIVKDNVEYSGTIEMSWK